MKIEKKFGAKRQRVGRVERRATHHVLDHGDVPCARPIVRSQLVGRILAKRDPPSLLSGNGGLRYRQNRVELLGVCWMSYFKSYFWLPIVAAILGLAVYFVFNSGPL